MTNSGQLQAQLLDWNPVAGGRFVRFLVRLIIITTLLIMIRIEMKMTRANVTLLLFSPPVPKKSSALSSMGLLIARAVGQAPAIKVASKGFFQLPQKWRQKRPTEIKRLERSLLRTFKPGPIFA